MFHDSQQWTHQHLNDYKKFIRSRHMSKLNEKHYSSNQKYLGHSTDLLCLLLLWLLSPPNTGQPFINSSIIIHCLPSLHLCLNNKFFFTTSSEASVNDLPRNVVRNACFNFRGLKVFHWCVIMFCLKVLWLVKEKQSF